MHISNAAVRTLASAPTRSRDIVMLDMFVFETQLLPVNTTQIDTSLRDTLVSLLLRTLR